MRAEKNVFQFQSNSFEFDKSKRKKAFFITTILFAKSFFFMKLFNKRRSSKFSRETDNSVSHPIDSHCL